LARTADWCFVPSSVGAWFTSGDGALGGVAKNVKSFVDQVLSSEPAVGFLDELDAIPSRETMDSRDRGWWTPVVTLVLTEIDRLRKSKRRVMLIGATNYYARLDPALIRPGRMQQRVSVLPPETDQEVIDVLRFYLGDALDGSDLAKLGRLGRGATPAAIEGWVKEARAVARAERRTLNETDILAQMIPGDARNPADIRAAAIHEIGHTVVALRLGHEVKSVSIVPEGNSGGLTMTRMPSVVPSWEELCDAVTVALGGRAADLVVGKGAHAGAEADLAGATELLRAALERQGLGNSLVHVPNVGAGSVDVRKAVDEQLQRLLKRAVDIVAADRALVLNLAERLVAEKMLSGAEIEKALGEEAALPSKGRRSEREGRNPPPGSL
ncbi:MAG: AAA family ATPase, partial [Alphaproteobacteria bacterium]|nr:AAA family ATPase [Alphaproteobacteria bacterium]